MELQNFSLHNFYNIASSWLLIHGIKVLIAVIVLLVGLKVIKYLGAHIRNRMSEKAVHSSLQPFFLSLAITALYILLIVFAMSIVDIPFSGLATILGGFTVGVGLALSGTFQNFAGGVLILLLKPFELNDHIIAQGQDGTVTSIQIFYTVLITADNKTAIIPNGKLFNEVIVNVTREGKRRLDFEVKLGYDTDVDQVNEIITKAVKATDKILTREANTVGVIAVEIDHIRYAVHVWVLPGDFADTRKVLQERIIKDLKVGGIQFLSPRDTHHF